MAHSIKLLVTITVEKYCYAIWNFPYCITSSFSLPPSYFSAFSLFPDYPLASLIFVRWLCCPSLLLSLTLHPTRSRNDLDVNFLLLYVSFWRQITDHRQWMTHQKWKAFCSVQSEWNDWNKISDNSIYLEYLLSVPFIFDFGYKFPKDYGDRPVFAWCRPRLIVKIES